MPRQWSAVPRQPTEFFNIINHPNFANPELPNFIADPAVNGLDPTGRGVGAYQLTATGDVGIGNPFLGSGGRGAASSLPPSSPSRRKPKRVPEAPPREGLCFAPRLCPGERGAPVPSW
jgi:hypothetical protein